MIKEIQEKHLTPILLIIILCLLIFIYFNSGQVQKIKSAVAVSKTHQAKNALFKYQGALTVFASVDTDAGTTKPFVLRSLNAQIKKPCGDINIDANQYDQDTIKKLSKNNTGCKTTILSDDPEIKKIFQLTNKPISFTVNDGVNNIVQEGFLFIMTASKGSYCTTTYLGGRQYEECVTEQEECDELRTYDLPFPEWSLNEFLEDYPECKELITK